MAFYKKCPNCGANLDPGEKCDCENSNDFESTKSNEPEGGQKHE